MKTISAKIKEIVADSGSIKNIYLTVIDREGKMQFINAPLIKSLHLNNTNIAGKKFFEFIQPSDLEAFKTLLADSEKSNSSNYIQFPLKNTSSQWMKWEVINFSSINKYLCVGYDITNSKKIKETPRQGAGQYKAIIESMEAEIARFKQQEALNITETSKTEQELKSSNERLLYITNASSEGIWEWNIQTGHVYRNLALRNMIGFVLENTHDLSWWFERVHPDDKKAIEEGINNVLNLKKLSWEMEYRFLCADNSYKVVYDKGFIIYENDQPVKMIGSLQDITEIKELELRLTQEKLLQQKKIGEAIVEAEERQRTSLGYELHDNVNQVLTTAKLYLEMMAPATEKDATILGKARGLLLEAINEIRNISKEMVLPGLKGKLLMESFRDVLEDIKNTGRFDTSFLHEGIKCEEIPEEKKLTLFRIAQEQLKNIIRHSGAATITVRLCQSNGQVSLVIKDDGIGFDPVKKSPGIGLSNIYDRVHLYKGTITLKTAPGEGCLLEISLPLA